MILNSRTALSKFTLAAVISSVLATSAIAQARSYRFDIANEPLSRALRSYSQIAEQEIIFTEDVVAGFGAPTVKGEFTPQEALEKLLEGTGLIAARSPSGAIMIRRVDKAPRQEGFRPISIATDSGESVRIAQTGEASASAAGENVGAQVATAENDVPSSKAVVELEEVLVTGSHIRGAQNLSSPVISFDRAAIERAGFTSVEQVMQSLPQSLNNLSDATVGAFAGGTADWAINLDGAGANLRGLGGDATLVLLNGRRMAPVGSGFFVDLSLFPVAAIERIDVLTDGASAIYGSDAVAGVVNLVLRDDFEGGETRVRYGSVTEGSHSERQASQMLGHAWGSGHALFSYDYLEKTDLKPTDRDFYRPDDPTETAAILLPPQTRHAALANFEQRLSDRIGLSSDLIYAKREGTAAFLTGPYHIEVLTDVEQYGASLGVDVDVGGNWELRATGQFDESRSLADYQVHSTGEVMYSYAHVSRLQAFDVAGDGPILSVPAGDVRLALGGHARRENYKFTRSPTPEKTDRDIAAAYAELLFPLIGAQNRRTGLERLELTVAGRYEDYSDFGSTFNPKVGLAWGPIEGLNVRTTWGTSFKAPLLSQVNPRVAWADLLLGRFMNGTGTTPVLMLTGNGVHLGPEESKNWTVGFDFTPSALPDLSISATYFEIDYEDRLSTPFTGNDELDGVLLNPRYDVVVTRNPNPSLVEALFTGTPDQLCYDYTARSYCNAGDHFQDVTAIIDGRLRNLAGVRMSGADFSLNYRVRSAVGNWDLSFSGSKLLENFKQIVPGAAWTRDLNEVGYPVDLRLRSGIAFSRKGLTAAAAISYTDEYLDTHPRRTGGAIRRSTVGSWTTVDLTAQYEIPGKGSGGLLDGLTLQLGVTNLFDRDPPYVANQFGLHYDGANAHPRGRFVSAQVSARW